MPLDPDVAELVRVLAETGAPALSDGTVEEARRNYDSLPSRKCPTLRQAYWHSTSL